MPQDCKLMKDTAIKRPRVSRPNPDSPSPQNAFLTVKL
jgi:hypothetical protein